MFGLPGFVSILFHEIAETEAESHIWKTMCQNEMATKWERL